MKKLTFLVVLSCVLISSGITQAIDVKVKAVADGTNNRLGNYQNGTGQYMWADGTSQFYNSRRRAVVKFDTTSLRGVDVRGLELNIWGFGNNGTAAVDVYHYSSDNWTDSSVPYASSLGSKMASMQLPSGSSYSYGKLATGLSNVPPYLGWYENQYLSMALVATGSNDACFVTRNGVSWDGSAGKAPYLTIRTWKNNGILDGNFNSGMGNWNITGDGLAQIVSNPFETGNAIEMTTGSPVSISQILDTPEDAFYINFDYLFETETGSLDVMLTDRNGTEFLAGQLLAQDAIVGQMAVASFHVQDLNLLYQDNVTLKLQFDGITGSQVLLDNIEFSAVPEPATMFLLAIGGFIVSRRKD